MSDHIIFLCFIIAGVIPFALEMRRLYYGQQAFSWPTAEAKLLDCSLESRKVMTKGGYRTYWAVTVSYSFSVNGYKFQRDLVSFDYESSTERDYHEAIYSKLHSAERVIVRYQPGNPWRAVLAPGVAPRRFQVLTALGLYLFLFGMLGLSSIIYPSRAQLGLCFIILVLIVLSHFIVLIVMDIFTTKMIDSTLIKRIQVVS